MDVNIIAHIDDVVKVGAASFLPADHWRAPAFDVGAYVSLWDLGVSDAGPLISTNRPAARWNLVLNAEAGLLAHQARSRP